MTNNLIDISVLPASQQAQVLKMLEDAKPKAKPMFPSYEEGEFFYRVVRKFYSTEDCNLSFDAYKFKQIIRQACNESWGNVVCDWSAYNQKKFGFGLNHRLREWFKYDLLHCQTVIYVFRTAEDRDKFCNENVDQLYLLYVE